MRVNEISSATKATSASTQASRSMFGRSPATGLPMACASMQRQSPHEGSRPGMSASPTARHASFIVIVVYISRNKSKWWNVV